MRAQFSILSVQEPGCEVLPIAVLLICEDKLLIRSRRPADVVTRGRDAEMLAAVIDDLNENAWKLPANQLIAYLEDTLSNWLRISDRRDIETQSPVEEIDGLYALYVDSQAHVPEM